MRSLIISIVILLLITVLVFVNSFIVTQKLNDMLNTLDLIYNINEKNTELLIQKLTKQWERTEALLSLTTRKDTIGEIEHLLTELTVAYYKEEEFDLILYRSYLRDLLTEIKNDQNLDLKSIL